MTSPYDAWKAMQLPQSQQKQAVDALVPGSIGAGPNPGTLGTLDSDPNQATNTQIALQRMAQGAAPIMQATDADGGAGFSHPAPATSPSLAMFQSVSKAAAVVENAGRSFADQVYVQIKKEAGQAIPQAPATPTPTKVAFEQLDPLQQAYELGRQFRQTGH